MAEGEDSVGVASWVVETALASHRGRRRQRRHRVLGGGDSRGDGIVGGGGQRQRWHHVVGGGDSIGFASWVAETASVSRCGWWRRRWHHVVGGGDDVGVASWAAETVLALRCGWQRRRHQAAAVTAERSQVGGGGNG